MPKKPSTKMIETFTAHVQAVVERDAHRSMEAHKTDSIRLFALGSMALDGNITVSTSYVEHPLLHIHKSNIRLLFTQVVYQFDVEPNGEATMKQLVLSIEGE